METAAIWWATNVALPPQRTAGINAETVIIVITLGWLIVISWWIDRKLREQPPDYWSDDEEDT